MPSDQTSRKTLSSQLLATSVHLNLSTITPQEGRSVVEQLQHLFLSREHNFSHNHANPEVN